MSTGIIMLLLTTVGDKLHRHYVIFIQASHDYFHHIIPYGRTYDEHGTGSYWLYSPSAALLFYPLSFLPKVVGNFLYMGTSLCLFFLALDQLRRALNLDVRSKAYGFFYLALSNEIIGSVFGSKIELLSTALFIFSIAWLIRDKRIFFSGVILGLAVSFKLQPVPLAGLIGLSLFLSHSIVRISWFFTGFFSSLALGWGYPFLILGKDAAITNFLAWHQTLSEVVRQTWGIYQSLYKLSSSVFGWPSNLAQLQFITYLAIGLYLFLFLMGTLGNRSRSLGQLTMFQFRLLWGAVLGSSFMVLFSPMHQGMASILATPLLLYGCLMVDELNTPYRAFGWASLFSYWYLTSLNFSDVVPKSLQIRDFPVQPLGFLILTCFCIVATFCSGKVPKERRS